MSGEPEIIKLMIPITERDHTYGPSTAPVTLVEYGDYECPYCGRAFPLIKELQKRRGEGLRFVFRHFPLTHVHPHALRAAEAAEAAAAQGRFWEMHDYLFKHQQALEDTHLSHYARKLGLDAARFDREMAEHLYAAQIQEDYNRSLYGGGVSGTPTFYINDVRHNDTVDLNRMLAAIDRASAAR